MPDRPTGTVTFLFTDIEGSTPLWDQRPEAMRRALAHHNALLRHAIEAHAGVVFKVVGDAFHAAFAMPEDAVAAAVEAQRALQSQPDEAWGETGPLRVRMGLHVGRGEWEGHDYAADHSLNQVARVMAAGHGGQILVSAAVAALVRGESPAVSLRDLGEHRLRGLSAPEHLYQVAAPGLRADFPPLRTLGTHPTNLPVPPTPLIGRETELAAIARLMQREGVRLVTLTGPGGTGKTRLALEVAHRIDDLRLTVDDYQARNSQTPTRQSSIVNRQFPDGVFFVNLAPITDPDLVVAAIAIVLDVREQGGRSLLDGLKHYLADRRLLLLLDNFEQVVPAGPLVAQLLAAAPGLKVLVTSREVLHLRGEHDWRVPPLALPPRTEEGLGNRDYGVGNTEYALRTTDYALRITHYAAVALFIERAQAVKPDFQVTNANAPAVAEICYRLDGLPLALELAAARIRLLPPPAMLQRLTSRLKLLTGGARDAQDRHKTLRGTIAWSYDLLSEPEQRLFRRLAVFVGGCTLAAAEAVTRDHWHIAGWTVEGEELKAEAEPLSFAVGGDEGDVLDGVASLLDKSLLRQEEDGTGEPRFTMLETIREFALEELEAKGEGPTLRRQHAAYYLRLAEEAEPLLRGPQAPAWLDRLEAEHDNLRGALTWSLRDPTRTALGLRLAAPLVWFWYRRGYLSEGRQWLDRLLAHSAGVPVAVRAKALSAAGTLAHGQTDHIQASRLHEAALALYRELGHSQGIAYSLGNLAAQALYLGDTERAARLLEEGRTLIAQTDDTWTQADMLNTAGILAFNQGEYEAAEALYEESLRRVRELGDRHFEAISLYNLGEVAQMQGKYSLATARFQTCLELAQAMRERWVRLYALQNLGQVALWQGDVAGALPLLRKSLALFKDLDLESGAAAGLETLASVALLTGDERRAARLLGAAEALRETTQVPRQSPYQLIFEREVAALRQALTEDEFARAWTEGRAMPPTQAVEYALENTAT